MWKSALLHPADSALGGYPPRTPIRVDTKDMSIYHYSVSSIGRSSGKSATAAAAYRAGEKIYDERTGLTFDYTRKTGVDYTEIIAPSFAPNWASARSLLWNEVERVERRKDSQLAREIDVALPVELDKEQKLKLVRGFVQEQFVELGMIADVACHHLNSHNPHAHILLTMRDLTESGLGKKNRSWNDRELLKIQREAWANHTNNALEEAGCAERVNHRSLEAQGINRIPQIHLGPNVAAMRKRGIATAKGDEYEAIAAANQELEALEIALAEEEKVSTETVLELKDFPEISKLAVNNSEEKAIFTPKRHENQLNDADIIRARQAVKEWKESNPEPIDYERADYLKEEVKKAKEKLKSVQEERSRLDEEFREMVTKRRGLLNPLGASKKALGEKYERYEKAREDEIEAEKRLLQAKKDWKHWQDTNRPKYEKITQMERLQKELDHPTIQKRLETIQAGWEICNQAEFILKQQGISTSQGKTYLNGQNYRIESEGDRLTISRRQSQEVICEILDWRRTEGVIQVEKFELTEPEREMLESYTYQLNEKLQRKFREEEEFREEQQQSLGFQLGQ